MDDPKVHEVGEDNSELQQKVEDVEKKFEDLLNAACGDLEKRKVPIRQIRESLYVCRATDTQTDTNHDTGHQCKIQEANTVEHLFEVLSSAEYWSFLNPGLLMRIIDDHCSESQGIQHRKREYLEKLQEFRKAITARQFANVCNVSTLSPKSFEVIFEMDSGWDGTLEDVENLKQTVCEQEFLHGHMFNFKGFKNSSLSLVWAFPCSCPISTTILRIPPSFYLEHGIRRVLVKGDCVADLKVRDSLYPRLFP